MNDERPKASPSLEDADSEYIVSRNCGFAEYQLLHQFSGHKPDFNDYCTGHRDGFNDARQQRRDAVAEFVRRVEEDLKLNREYRDVVRLCVHAVAREMLDPSATLSPDAHDQDIQAVQPDAEELPVCPDDETGEVHP